MTRSQLNGWPIVYENCRWLFENTKEPIGEERPCKHCHVQAVPVLLNGSMQSIDQCIVRIVAALNIGGVTTTASCCGHGEGAGKIDLEDGRVLGIFKDAAEYEKYTKERT